MCFEARRPYPPFFPGHARTAMERQRELLAGIIWRVGTRTQTGWWFASLGRILEAQDELDEGQIAAICSSSSSSCASRILPSEANHHPVWMRVPVRQMVPASSSCCRSIAVLACPGEKRGLGATSFKAHVCSLFGRVAMQIIASSRCDVSIDSGPAPAKNLGTTLAFISGRAHHRTLRPTAYRYGH